MKRLFSRVWSFMVLTCLVLYMIPWTPETAVHVSAASGTHIYVGYDGQSPNYAIVQEAVNAAASINPKSEDQRVYIHIAPGTYR